MTLASLAPLTLGTTTLAIGGLQISPAVAEQFYQHSGNEFPDVQAAFGAAPRIQFQTPVGPALALLGLKFAVFTAADLYLATFASGLRQTSGHTKFSLAASAKAFAWISAGSVKQNGIAMATVDLIYLSPDAVTHPIARGTAALPTVSSTQLHTMGPCVINGTRISGASGLNFTNNAIVSVLQNDGDRYPRDAGWMGAAPTLGIAHQDPVSMLAAIDGTDANDGAGLDGINITAATGFYLRGIDPVTQLPQTTGISLLANAGRVTPGNIQADTGKPAEMGLNVRGLSSTATHPFVYSAAATLP